MPLHMLVSTHEKFLEEYAALKIYSLNFPNLAFADPFLHVGMKTP